MGLIIFEKILNYSMIIFGLYFFFFFFNKKQHQLRVESLGEKTANIALKGMRYGGPFLILCGIILLML